MKFVFLSVLFCAQLIVASENFPEVTNAHPFSEETFQNIEIGEPYATRSWRHRYLNRVVTLYNTSFKREPLPRAPRFHEACHDSGDRFANWSQTESFTRSVQAGLELSLLGFAGLNISGEYSRDFSFSFERWIHATAGVEAMHSPFIEYTVYEGKSYLQTINLKTGESYNSPLDDPEFYVDYISPYLLVEREVLSSCD